MNRCVMATFFAEKAAERKLSPSEVEIATHCLEDAVQHWSHALNVHKGCSESEWHLLKGDLFYYMKCARIGIASGGNSNKARRVTEVFERNVMPDCPGRFQVMFYLGKGDWLIRTGSSAQGELMA